jgi:uncharacterized protein
MSAENLEVMWSPWEGPGLEHLRLRVGEDGIEADGIFIEKEDVSALRARYVVRCDRSWRTRELILDPLDWSDPLHLRSSGEGDWRDAS